MFKKRMVNFWTCPRGFVITSLTAGLFTPSPHFAPLHSGLSAAIPHVAYGSGILLFKKQIV